jgi:hypothetical protein
VNGNGIQILITNVNESGLYAKWNKEILAYASKIFELSAEKLSKINDKSEKHVVKIKSALGPFFAGVFASIIIFVFEISILKKFLKTRTNANKLFMNIRRNYFH